MILKEFLVSLGLKDDMSEKLNQSMQSADSTVSKFAKGFGKKFALAGTAVVSFVGVAAGGLAKFAKSLMNSDDELTRFQRKFGMTRVDAYKTKSALDIMGKSLEEVHLDPLLFKQFTELKKNAADLKVPDMSEGLSTVRDITTSVLALKQTAMNALQWVGHSFLKHVAKPMETIQLHLKNFNTVIKKNIPDWSDKIGKALSWVVQLGGTIIRAGGQMLGAVKKVFDAIPSGVKVAMAALGALAAFIKMGPVGKLITIISVALLLLDDFFTYLDGGDSLLAPVWKTLTGFFSGFEKSGKDALKFFTEDFLPKLVDYVSGIFPKLVEKVLSYVDPFVDWITDVITSIIDTLAAAIPELLKLAGNIALAILDGLLSKIPKILDAATNILKSLTAAIKKMIPKLLETVGDIIKRLVDIIAQSLPEILDAAVNLVLAVVDGVVDALPDILDAVVGLLDKLLVAIIDALPKLIDAGIQIVEKLVEGVLKALPKIISTVVELIKSLVATLKERLPELIKAGIQIIKSLIEGIVKMLPEIIKAAVELVTQLVSSIAEMLPEIIEAGIEILFALIDGIIEALPDLLDAVIGLIPVIVQAVTDNLPKIIKAGIEILLALIKGIIKAIPKIIKAVIDLIPVIVNALIKALPQIIEAGIEIILALAAGLIQAIPQLVAAIPEIIGAIVESFGGIFDAMGGIISRFVDIFKNAFTAVANFFQNIWGGITDFFSSVWNSIVSVIQGIPEFFKGIFEGAVNGIKNAFNGVKEFFQNLFDAVINIIKAPINWIIGGINTFIGGLNKLKIPDWVPIVGGKGLNIPTIPELEKGGVLEKGQTGYLEGNGAEAVVPLEKNTEWITKVADQLRGKLNGDGNGDKGKSALEKVIQTLIVAIQKLYTAITKLVSKKGDSKNLSGGKPANPVIREVQAVKDKVSENPLLGKLLGKSADKTDKKAEMSEVGERILAFLDSAEKVMTQMSQITHSSVAYNSVSNSKVSYNTTTIDNKQNYTINDTSGNPRTTAEMVGKTQELHSRNLKGVFA